MGIAKEVCRIEKLKSIGALGGAYEHNLRLKNIINAIYGVEFMLTFGTEATDKIDINQWCTDNMKWLETHFGGKQNIVSAILHLDERTPHIHALIIPLDEKGKLNYTKYLGGTKYRLSELQDSYHQEVGILHQLDRGMKGSKATHQDIDNFYSMVNETVKVPELPTPEKKTGLFSKSETAVEYHQRITPEVQHLYSLAIAKEKENILLKKRIADIEHLQDGVVPADLYNDNLHKLNHLKAVLRYLLEYSFYLIFTLK